MRAQAPASAPPDKFVVRLCLLPRGNYLDLAGCLNHIYQRQRYRVCLDLCAVSHWGTVEFRMLTYYARIFKQHGGFLELENASAAVTKLAHDFGCTHLLASLNPQPSTR